MLSSGGTPSYRGYRGDASASRSSGYRAVTHRVVGWARSRSNRGRFVAVLSWSAAVVVLVVVYAALIPVVLFNAITAFGGRQGIYPDR